MKLVNILGLELCGNTRSCTIFYSIGAVALTGNDIDRFGIGTGPIHLDDLDCSGDETDLFKCPRRSDCLHSEDASVVCPADDGKYYNYVALVFMFQSMW